MNFFNFSIVLLTTEHPNHGCIIKLVIYKRIVLISQGLNISLFFLMHDGYN